MKLYDRKTREYIMKQAFSRDELLRLESLCVQEEPPFCRAACPINIDGRALCAAVADGDFDKGRGILETATPFLNVLARCCDSRCSNKCRIAEIGDGVSVNALERACVEYGSSPKARRLLMRKKPQRVAIFGDGLFCAALGWELGKKSFDITLFCEGASLADGLLAELPELPRELAERDLVAATEKTDKIEYNVVVTAQTITDAVSDYDVVCCSKKLFDTLGGGEVDAVTLLCDSLGVFTELPAEGDALKALADAKRASVSIDRFVQGVPVGRDRPDEGVGQSKLYTSLEGVQPSKSLVFSGEPLSREDAIAEAARCIRCECLECVKKCKFMQRFGRYPRQALHEIHTNLAIIMGDHLANGMINSCAECGQCGVICPNGFDLGEICGIARETMYETRKMPPSTHEFAILDMEFSISDEYFSARLPEGKTSCDYAFFPGCQMGAALPETTARAYADLNERLGGVGLLLGCCGAIGKWSGRGDELDACVERLKAAYAELSEPALIVACPTCAKTLKEFVADSVVGVWDILLDLGAPKGAKRADKLFIHDACGARGDEATQNSIRSLAASLGCETADSTLALDRAACCGYGGLVSYANRELAREMSDFCLENGEGDCLTYCPNCRDLFTKRGAKALHILELAYGEEVGGSPTLSERRANRKRLRARLLKEHWGEKSVDKQYDFKVEFPESIVAEMEDRMILDSDVYETLENARATKSAIRDRETGELITTRRIGNVQFWVRCRETEGGYTLTGVYSHRMTIREL